MFGKPKRTGVRVQGRRAVVCCSLAVAAGMLRPNWDAALEAAYDAGSANPAADAAENNEPRAPNR